MVKPLAALAAAALVLSACSAGGTASTGTGAAAETSAAATQTTASSVAAKYGLAGQDVTEIINTLDATPKADRIQTLHASIQPNELVLTDAETNATESITMPADSFYVSFSPYVSQTHECYFHSLTTCTGELQNVAMDVTVTNDAGDAIISDTLTSGDNGFIGLWLPRDTSNGTLEVSYDGKSVTVPLSTVSADDPTCLTQDMKLS